MRFVKCFLKIDVETPPCSKPNQLLLTNSFTQKALDRALRRRRHEWITPGLVNFPPRLQAEKHRFFAPIGFHSNRPSGTENGSLPSVSVGEVVSRRLARRSPSEAVWLLKGAL